MNIRIGDRIQDPDDDEILEVVKIEGCNLTYKIIKESSRGLRKGYLEIIEASLLLSDVISRDWIYLGNFSKSENFKNFFERLNG